MKTLTARQKQVLDFIASYHEAHAYPPTIREIAERFEISVKGAYDHVKALGKKGCIRLGDNRSRALELVGRDGGERSSIELPLLGEVAAGRPILAEENFAGTVCVPADIARSGECFALTVRGDSNERRRYPPWRHRRHRAASACRERGDRGSDDRRFGDLETIL
jgi:repressor LexA